MSFEIGTFIENLSRCSAESPGVTRLPFTEASQMGWEYICRTMEALGLAVRTDPYGTILGHLEGERPERVVIGSHYDSVIHGGKYDGVAGIAVGLMAAAHFVETGTKPAFSLDILANNDEEGITFTKGFLSSKRVCGLLKEGEYKNPMTGKTLKTCLAQGWYAKGGRGRDDIRLTTALERAVCIIEPHIEQGGILWSSGERIGVVRHIVGCTRLYVTVNGLSNHAGTTPMNLRRDPLAAAGRIIGQIPQLTRAYPGAVATVGQIFCMPNVSNVIPNQVRFTVDIRSASDADRKRLGEEVRRLVARESPMEFEIIQGAREEAVPMKTELVRAMEEICGELGIAYRVMDSGAVHDAQVFGTALDTVMLFIPSRDGLSHCPEEFSRLEDLETAARVLVRYCEGGGSEN